MMSPQFCDASLDKPLKVGMATVATRLEGLLNTLLSITGVLMVGVVVGIVMLSVPLVMANVDAFPTSLPAVQQVERVLIAKLSSVVHPVVYVYVAALARATLSELFTPVPIVSVQLVT